jgi:single-strand DNA-binding protein
MMNEAQISLTGYVATQPMWRETNNGRPNLSMRVAWTPRRLDRTTGEWTDGNTSYVTVTCWRKLADHVAVCLRKGDPVVVQGRVSVRSYEDKQGMPRTAVDVDAYSVGHDLNRGVAMFQRTRPQTGKTADEYAAGLEADGAGDETGQAEGGGIGSPGTGGGAAGLGALDGAGQAVGSGEAADDQMFDKDAIDALATEGESAAVPF